KKQPQLLSALFLLSYLNDKKRDSKQFDVIEFLFLSFRYESRNNEKTTPAVECIIPALVPE
ncbi:hypothetical protein PS028_24115, partial [Shigella sonnei]|nr:hypothetical protein [Shigella sonnei]